MEKVIGFHHGALVDKYEKQANEQGYTLGNKAEVAEKLGFGINVNYVHGVITEAEKERAFKRLNKWLIKNIKVLGGRK